MPEYRVEFAASAAREFRALPANVKRRVTAAVDSLRTTQRPAGVRKLTGSDRLYRIRVGHYRIVYEINDKANLVRVTRVRHRREAYQ